MLGAKLPLAALTGPHRPCPIVADILTDPAKTIETATHRSIATIYDQLAMAPGPSRRVHT